MTEIGPEVAPLLAAAEEFTVPLRMGDGVDEAACNRLRDALHQCAVAWRARDVVPKLAVNTLVDLYPAVEASSSLYPEDQAISVRAIAEETGDLVRSCLAL